VNPTPVQIRDIAEARRFYPEVLGCLEDAKGTSGLTSICTVTRLFAASTRNCVSRAESSHITI
jgi:hypothetical protein